MYCYRSEIPTPNSLMKLYWIPRDIEEVNKYKNKESFRMDSVSYAQAQEKTKKRKQMYLKTKYEDKTI